MHRFAPAALALAALALGALLLDGCGEEDSGAGPDEAAVPNPSFAYHVAPLLSSFTCTSSACHAAPDPAAGLNLVSVQPAYLIGQSADSGHDLVIPFDAESSYLVSTLEGRGYGARMPYGLTPLPIHDIGTIRNWIDEGALDN